MKAEGNVVKHGVSFGLATSVLRDPLAFTIFDTEHSEGCDVRWVTIGIASAMSEDEMREEYDFSKAGRGKFYRANARFHSPIYLEEAVMGPLSAIAERKGIQVDALVNDLLKKELAIAEALR